MMNDAKKIKQGVDVFGCMCLCTREKNAIVCEYLKESSPWLKIIVKNKVKIFN